MAKRKRTLTYDEQTELCYRVLCLFPSISYNTIVPLFDTEYGTMPTRSCFARAKHLLTDTPPVHRRKKDQYIIALFTLFPDIAIDHVRAKTRLYFGEDTRSDVVEAIRLRVKGSTTPPLMSVEEAKKLLGECEQRIVPSVGFDLSEGGGFEDSAPGLR